MKRQDDTGLEHLYDVLRGYDDGIVRTVAARKRMEIAELELAIGDGEPTRSQASLLRYLKEDCMVYETIAFIMSIPKEEFQARIDEIGTVELGFEPVPRAVMDSYRRGLSDLDLRMEDRAAGYADDIVGFINSTCDY